VPDSAEAIYAKKFESGNAPCFSSCPGQIGGDAPQCGSGWIDEGVENVCVKESPYSTVCDDARGFMQQRTCRQGGGGNKAFVMYNTQEYLADKCTPTPNLSLDGKASVCDDFARGVYYVDEGMCYQVGGSKTLSVIESNPYSATNSASTSSSMSTAAFAAPVSGAAVIGMVILGRKKAAKKATPPKVELSGNAV
jgi:hypothetical protein